MSKDKEIINKLVKVVAQQQQIITKLAQAVAPVPAAPVVPAATPSGDMRASVEADIMDLVYGKGAKLPMGSKVQVHYAKLQDGATGKVLLVGLTVPEAVQAKWQSMQSSIEMALKNKYSVTAVSWRS